MLVLLCAGCAAGDKQRIDLLAIAVLFAAPLFGLQVGATTFARTQKQPQISLAIVIILGIAAMVVTGMALQTLGEAPVEVRVDIATRQFAVVAVLCAIIVAMMLFILGYAWEQASHARPYYLIDEAPPPPRRNSWPFVVGGIAFYAIAVAKLTDEVCAGLLL
ncbi:MAG: hypothetical protein HOW73_14215 [Polyangiaceae bacterium]|nr:hypothetical protein [Polyangiaceae bacterium]